MTDAVDAILNQWHRERPDLDPTPMGTIGRLSRTHRLIAIRLNAVFAEHDLGPWDFDVLATLRRSGEPYQLTAGQLLESMMITSGAITNRIDRLEARGLVTRTPSATDARVREVTLTPAGLGIIDAAVTDHVANERAIVEALTTQQRSNLDDALRSLLAALEPPK